jgi:hypothetical protein
VAATVDLVAELHTRAVGHPVLAECRRYGEDFVHHFTANGDARTALVLSDPGRAPSPSRPRSDRLLDASIGCSPTPRRARLMAGRRADLLRRSLDLERTRHA